MAKGRKLNTSRSELLLGSYQSHGQQSGDGGNGASSELGEEDVWSAIDDGSYGDDGSRWSPPSGSGRSRAPRRVSRDERHRHLGGLSLAFEDSGSGVAAAAAAAAASTPRVLHQYRGHDNVATNPRGRHAHVASSAPMNVPDWSKVYRVNSIESLPDSDDAPDDCDWEMMPPHEYLAREYASSRKSAAASVFEGVGRTLKGRDMSRVRDAVWSQTGFDG